MNVDFHTHFFPANLPDLGGREPWPHLVMEGEGSAQIMCGTHRFRKVAASCWDIDARVVEMDNSGIDVHVISPVPITLTYWADTKRATEYARIHNDGLAGAVAGSGGRFRGLGTVPLQDADAAIVEMGRATTELGLAGLEIGTVVDGRELDDPSLRPFFAAAQELRVPLFIHPTDGSGATRRSSPVYDFGVGMLADTALAATALVFGGVLDTYPDLRIALAHGCGAFPWMYPRIKLLAESTRRGAAPEFDALVRTLWADSLVFDPEHVRLLGVRFGFDHLMMGSDFPFVPLAWNEAVIEGVVDKQICTADEALAMRGANALRFLRQSSE